MDGTDQITLLPELELATRPAPAYLDASLAMMDHEGFIPGPEDAPVSHILWVPIEKVHPNDYNPNQVAKPELRLLYISIKHDGYTQPVVVVADRKCGIHLPCGDIIEVDGGHPIWKMFSPLNGSLDIRLESLTEKDQLVSFMEKIIGKERVDTEFKCHKQNLTMDETCANGSEINGKWEESIAKTGFALFGFGMSLESMISIDSSRFVCPICESRSKEHPNSWKHYLAIDRHDGEYGLLLSCLSSEVMEGVSPQRLLRNGLVEPLTQSGQSEGNLESMRQNGTRGNILQLTDQSEAIIVDGFHRYYIMQTYKDIYDRYHGRLPVVVLDKDIKDRMASTVRHNRARGKHSVGGMGILVIQLAEKGWADEAICNELGIEPDEMLRLRHTSGIAELYKNREFGRSWEEVQTIRDRKEVTGGQ